MLETDFNHLLQGDPSIKERIAHLFSPQFREKMDFYWYDKAVGRSHEEATVETFFEDFVSHYRQEIARCINGSILEDDKTFMNLLEESSDILFSRIIINAFDGKYPPEENEKLKTNFLNLLCRGIFNYHERILDRKGIIVDFPQEMEKWLYGVISKGENQGKKRYQKYQFAGSILAFIGSEARSCRQYLEKNYVHFLNNPETENIDFDREAFNQYKDKELNELVFDEVDTESLETLETFDEVIEEMMQEEENNSGAPYAKVLKGVIREKKSTKDLSEELQIPENRITNNLFPRGSEKLIQRLRKKGIEISKDRWGIKDFKNLKTKKPRMRVYNEQKEKKMIETLTSDQVLIIPLNEDSAEE